MTSASANRDPRLGTARSPRTAPAPTANPQIELPENVISASSRRRFGSDLRLRRFLGARGLGRHRAIALVVAAFIVLGVIYSVTTPVFEASDELCHFPVVAYIAQGHGLPVQDPTAPQIWRQEGSQPPLYYALSALLVSWIDLSDLPTIHDLNPHADIGRVAADGNANMVVHTTREAFPYRGTSLAVHLVRWLSVLMGAVTVALTYATASAIFPDHREVALLAAAFAAFNPMFLFVSGSVNNDTLVAMLGALALYWIVCLERGQLTLLRLAGLGAVIGLAALSKVSALGLLPLAGLALVVVTWRRRDLGLLLTAGAVLAATVAALVGWWTLRNWQLYGDPLGLNAMVAIAGPRHPRPNLLQLTGEWQGFVWSFWGLFGGLNVPLEGWTYTLLDALAMIGAVGLILLAVRSKVRQTWRASWLAVLLLAAWPAIVFVALIRWTLMTQASQGRLMFSALSALCILFALGWVQWLPARARPIGTAALASVLFAVAALTPFRVIAPAYARAATLPAQSVPNRLDVTFGDRIQLMGYDVDRTAIVPGDRIAVTVYWRALQAIDRDYSVFVHLLGSADILLAQRDTYPGRGLMPTSTWIPGQAFGDTIMLTVPRNAYAPDTAQIELGVYDFTTGQRLPATAVDGKALGDNLRFHKMDLQPADGGRWPNPVYFNFENKLALVGYALEPRTGLPGDTLRVRLYWQALSKMDQDYTVFVHILGVKERLWGQNDGALRDGAALTSGWQSGAIVEDEHAVQIEPYTPPDLYDIEVGVYLPTTGQRLGVLAEGGRLDADRVLLTRARVFGR
jgi:4-amino-4-deoxy-L-arabinose transferase-like glycosyltransferase